VNIDIADFAGGNQQSRMYGKTGISDWIYEGLYAANAIKHLAQKLHDLSFARRVKQLQ
tara:strand:- start:10 stop:183 length:174 start_codon:yes stop_codon:yes gene_type:complete